MDITKRKDMARLPKKIAFGSNDVSVTFDDLFVSGIEGEMFINAAGISNNP